MNLDSESATTRKEIDYQDAKALWRFALENVEFAELYAEARKDYALALRHLKLELAKAYRDRLIDRKMAEDKAYLVLADNNDCCHDALKVMLEKEAEYKGREKVLEARAGALSFNQSLLKYEPK